MRSSPSASPSKSSASSRALLLPRRLKSSVAQASTRLIDQGSEFVSVTSLRGFGARRASLRNAGDLQAGLGDFGFSRVWVPRGPVKRERIRGPLEFRFREAASDGHEHRAAGLPLPAPPGPIPKTVAPHALIARARRERDLFDLRRGRREIHTDRLRFGWLRAAGDRDQVYAAAGSKRER